MKKERVYCLLDRRNVIAIRESNQTILIKKERKNPIINSDNSIIEDKYGHRYSRQIELETYINSDFYIYTII